MGTTLRAVDGGGATSVGMTGSIRLPRTSSALSRSFSRARCALAGSPPKTAGCLASHSVSTRTTSNLRASTVSMTPSSVSQSRSR